MDAKAGAGRTVSFNWDIHWLCDYDCPYCWFHGQWKELAPRNVRREPGIVVRAWEHILAKYGRCRLSITGGEPLLYPGFADIVAGISRSHDVEVISNLSADIGPFLDKTRGRCVVVNPSFHPLFADQETFMQRVLALKERDMVRSVTILAWPPTVPDLARFQESFLRAGIRLTVQSYHGTFGGKRYPEGYSEAEREAILPAIGERGGRKFRMEPLVTRGRSCSAGRTYGVIHPDGTVLRCGGMQSSSAVVGNLFDEGFSLLAEPLPCASEICPCNEWAFLLEDEPRGALS